MKFNTSTDMLSYLAQGDLYSPSNELYVFSYNDLGSICVYHSITKEDADELSRITEDGYWAQELGYKNNSIYDSIEWFKAHNVPIDKDINTVWCKQHLDITDWINTKNWKGE